MIGTGFGVRAAGVGAGAKSVAMIATYIVGAFGRFIKVEQIAPTSVKCNKKWGYPSGFWRIVLRKLLFAHAVHELRRQGCRL